MIQVADYTLRDGAVPRPEPPTPEPGSKYTYFDTFTRRRGRCHAGRGPRRRTHIDWTRSTGGLEIPQMSDVVLTHSIYGEMVATYYTLAWLDRYLAETDANADEALRAPDRQRHRPLRRPPPTVHSIGAGFFDPDTARARGDEAGNMPIEIAGIAGREPPLVPLPDAILPRRGRRAVQRPQSWLRFRRLVKAHFRCQRHRPATGARTQSGIVCPRQGDGSWVDAEVWSSVPR